MSLVYKNEKPLFALVAVVSGLFWLALVAGTLGIVLLYVPFIFLGYCFAQSAFIAYIRGTAVELGPEQMPELHQQFLECCERLGQATPPRAYIVNAGGMMNALATRFLRTHYVILFSDVVDGLMDHPAALDFYIGHEVGHIKRGHLAWGWFVGPGMMMPLIGPAYSRAREYTCDLHGLACCDEPKDAAIAIGLLAAGEHGWKTLNINRYAKQSDDAKGFWMSFHELTGDYPWLTKRMKHVMATASGRHPTFPGRNPFAYFFALFIPRLGGGSAGSLAGMMAMVAVVGILAAVAIPNFVAFQERAKVAGVRSVRDTVQTQADAYIAQTGYLPGSLSEMGLPEGYATPHVTRVEIAEAGFVLHLDPELAQQGEPPLIELSPYRAEDGSIGWNCSGNLAPHLVDEACSSGAPTDAGAAGGLAAALANAMQQPTAAPTPQEAGSGTPASRSLEPNAETCSNEFRQGPGFQQLAPEQQDALRSACNLWKLQQL